MALPNKKKQLNLVRIMGTGVNAELPLLFGLSKIKGISVMFANALCHSLAMDKHMKISELSEKDIETIEACLTNPVKPADIPAWLFNQRKELETGLDHHLITKDIDFNQLQMMRRIGKLKTYKGQRLKLRLTVRGQRTKSNFRRSKTLAAMKAKSGGKK
jgi:small subunit ribosomal protein S13